MKAFLLILLASSTVSFAGDTYDPATGVLQIPIVSAGATYYKVNMLHEGNLVFSVTSLTPTLATSKLSDSFDFKTETLHIPNVSVGLDNYQVDMSHLGSLVFKVISVTPNSKENTKFSGKLNDTGVTWGAEGPTSNNLACTGVKIDAQDCSTGRDITHNDDSDGHAGFSFVKLDANGNDLPISAQSWSCVLDNVTGLIWEVKTNDGGIHDKDNDYRWGGTTAIGDRSYGTFYDDWDELVNGSNKQQLCGYSNWRVPALAELQSIVDYGRGTEQIAIDENYFPNTEKTAWSATPEALTEGAWNVSFKLRTIFFPRSRTHQVRLVNKGQ